MSDGYPQVYTWCALSNNFAAPPVADGLACEQAEAKEFAAKTLLTDERAVLAHVTAIGLVYHVHSKQLVPWQGETQIGLRNITGDAVRWLTPGSNNDS